jgi:hypothetical protein
MWQLGIGDGDFGEGGPDKGMGDKLLVLGPGQADPKAAGYRVVPSPMFSVFIGFRVLTPDPQAAKALLDKFRVYGYDHEL